ncbi:sensor histidine kinase [Undibacterium fentianense]|uniref:Histidine kinase n=1 Tax=Undibacterium fentianense TaxID=2828728 RepID=A0A941E4E3_9BURK|nr:histidine kinase [Undibacterium fentianense]MBR7801321.1 histidine kinase [Undibacterium fentianense]
MNPFIANLRTAFLTTLVWLMIGILMAVALVLSNLTNWERALIFAIPPAIIFSFVSASAYYVCRSLPIKKRRFLLVCGLFGGTSFISGLIFSLICGGWNVIISFLHEARFGIPFTYPIAVFIIISGSLFYLLSLLAYDVLIAFDNVRYAERREAESEVLAREAELQVLRTQINPHFLFNSLNSISALTAIDANAARNMTIELAQFFRLTLSLSERQKITLAEEIALCKHFLTIEKIRFGQKLQIQMDINPDTESCLLPPMLLQPLLENAIKHGIRDLVDGGTIHLTSKIRAPWLFISIENPIDVVPSLAIGTGTGLKNLSARIQSLYGDKSRVESQRNPHSFRVEIALPLER